MTKWFGLVLFLSGALLATGAITVPVFESNRYVQLVLGLLGLGASWRILRRY